VQSEKKRVQSEKKLMQQEKKHMRLVSPSSAIDHFALNPRAPAGNDFSRAMTRVSRFNEQRPAFHFSSNLGTLAFRQ